MSGLEILGLPEELLECILRHVKDTGPSETFWSCLRTCQKLHRIGLGLYSGLGFAAPVIIESDTRRNNVQQQSIGSSFHLTYHVELRPPSQLYLSLLKSLTVHVQHQRVAVPSLPAGRDLVTSLMAIFPLTKRLTTFSLKFSDGWDFPSPDVPAVPQSLLAQLVGTLPKTVVHLELDTASTDVPPSTKFAESSPTAHLCYQIGRILTRLRRLRLRVGHVCDTLLGFEVSDPGCSSHSNCEYCISNERATCTLLRCWKMCAMTIWLPRFQNEATERFIQASAALLNPSLHNPAIILLVHQRDLEYSEYYWGTRTAPINAHYHVGSQNFSWTPQSNVTKALSERPAYFTFTALTGNSRVIFNRETKDIGRPPQESERPCREHSLLQSATPRRFHISPSLGTAPESGSTLLYSYMAEQTIENMLSWVQNTYRGYRFPIALSDEPGEAFWKSERIWACRFPGCGNSSESLVHLRGHHIRAHQLPHSMSFDGCSPCPSFGCDRKGNNGFMDLNKLEKHILQHHLGPCTRVES